VGTRIYEEETEEEGLQMSQSLRKKNVSCDSRAAAAAPPLPEREPTTNAAERG